MFIKIQEMYDFREKSGFCSGSELHEFFTRTLGDPSPSGKKLISVEVCEDFINECIEVIIENSSSLTEEMQNWRVEWRKNSASNKVLKYRSSEAGATNTRGVIKDLSSPIITVSYSERRTWYGDRLMSDAYAMGLIPIPDNGYREWEEEEEANEGDYASFADEEYQWKNGEWKR